MAIGFTLFFLVVLIFAVVDAIVNRSGALRDMLIALFWLVPLSGSLWLLVYFATVVTVTADRIERSSIFGTKTIMWREVKELTRGGAKDMYLIIKGSATKIAFDCHYYERGEFLRNQVLPYVKEPALERSFIWRPFFRGCGWIVLIFDGIAVAVIGSISVYSPQSFRDPLTVGSLIGFLIFPIFLMNFITLGLHWVTDYSVRADPFLGVKRELKWHELRSITIACDYENPEIEVMEVEGYTSVITLRSINTPNYAQLRDKILKHAKCPVRRDR